MSAFPHGDDPERRPCIVGIGETAYRRRGGHAATSEFTLCLEAVRAAAHDAGIAPAQLDGYTSFGFERHEPVIVQNALAAPALNFSAIVWGGAGGGCCASVMLAAMAVASGMSRYAVAYRSLCQGQYERYGEFRPRPAYGQYMAPFGLMAPAQMTALTFRRHMHAYGTSSEHLAEVALSARANAQKNPRAVTFGKPLDREAYFDARYIAEPFRLYDCCLETDGACAVVVMSQAEARRLGKPAVPIEAAAQASGARWSLGPMGTHNMPIEDYCTTNSSAVAKALYGQAGLRPSDIGVAQIYDAFSGLIPMALEDYGLCERGASPAFIASGALREGGALPINTAGGLLSEAYLHGLNLVIEGVRQMRGESTAQVRDARHCLVTSGGGGGHKSALILGRT
jgi:acetyl-CoA acetyltransferase